MKSGSVWSLIFYVLLLTVMVIVVLIVLGLILGSFINAFVWRHYRRAELALELEQLQQVGKGSAKRAAELKSKRAGLSINHGRSMCTHCKHELGPLDLIPVFSFIWLRGKCRYCGERIEDTPLAELLLPLFFVVSYVWWPLGFSGQGLLVFMFWLIFVAGFTALILYDLRWFLLPHSIVLPLIGLAVVQVVSVATFYHGGGQTALNALLGALVIGGLFYVLYKVSHEQWIGGGDVTLGVLLGLLVGGPMKSFMVIFIASLLGTLLAVPLLALGKANRSTHLPFGPFLMFGAVITMLFGTRILDWYTTSFLHISGAFLLH